MEYRKVMDATKKKTFNEAYEELIKEYSDDWGFSEELQAKLKAKRDFGVEKYGEYSFQSSFENAITVPIYDHLNEELIDALNYCLHARFLAGLKDPKSLPSIESKAKIISSLLGDPVESAN